MTEALHKFPSTPHLAWLGSGTVRDDKVLTETEVERFLERPLVVEEKVDGANLGISMDPSRGLRFQNRGQWLKGKLTGQWERLRGWAAEHEGRLREVLPAHHILFGEWCYARHAVNYDRLPDWFLAFDVYDSASARFWSANRRSALAATAGVSAVPELARGVFRREDLLAMLDGRSTLNSNFREGLYLRREQNDCLVERAKLVRADFTQALSEHWTKRAMVLNQVRDAKEEVH